MFVTVLWSWFWLYLLFAANPVAYHCDKNNCCCILLVQVLFILYVLFCKKKGYSYESVCYCCYTCQFTRCIFHSQTYSIVRKFEYEWECDGWQQQFVFYTLACFTTALIIVLFGCQTLTAGWGNLALELSVQFKACFFNLEWFFSNLQKPISYRNLCVHFLSCWLCFYISII